MALWIQRLRPEGHGHGPGMPGAPRGCEKQKVHPRACGGSTVCPHLDFGLPSSAAITEYISVVFSSLACDHLRQPQATGTPTLHAGHTSWLSHSTRPPSLSHTPPSTKHCSQPPAARMGLKTHCIPPHFKEEEK